MIYMWFHMKAHVLNSGSARNVNMSLVVQHASLSICLIIVDSEMLK